MDWTWTGSFSNSYAVFEIIEATSADGGRPRHEPRVATNDTTGNLDSTAFATDGGNSVLLVGVLQEDPTLEDPSSVSDAAGSYTKVGSSINIDSTHRIMCYARRERFGGRGP